jgi:hypothetical protein
MSEWHAEKAYVLACQALDYLERVYPKGASLEPLEPYRQAVLEAQDAGDFEAYEEALRQMMRAGRRVAQDARQSRGAA